MNTKTAIEIYTNVDKNGKPRAYRVNRMQFRSFPIGYEKAMQMVATGEAIRITRPFWLPSIAASR